jgi:hypothetical protein
MKTAIRILHTVLSVPVGQWVATADVHRSLLAQGHSISRRSVQRDLHNVASEFAIEHRQPDVGRDIEWRRTRSLEAA